ncbi:MAG: DegV family protein [Chloroflexota bacterium]
MAPVGIVTDSVSCLPPELIREYDIRVVPVGLVIDRKTYRDQVDITPAEFYRIYPGLKERPTTTAPSPGEFAEIFTQVAQNTDSILCIVVSSLLSAIHGSAEQARQLMKEENPRLKIELVDSKTAAGALGFIVLEAARAAKGGKSLAEVLQTARDMIPRVKFLAVLDTLKYLIKGGRAPKVAILGEILQVKPIIGLVSDRGMVDPLSRARTKRRSLAKMVDMLPQYTDVTQPLHVMVNYSEDRAEGEELLRAITSRFNCVEAYLTELTPVMSCHSGPMVGISFYV